MSASFSRRTFLGSAAAGTLAGLRPVSASETVLDPSLVRLDAGIEPLVTLLEVTPRDKLLEEVGGRIKKGLAYQELLTALFLAGVRNVQPRPTVGFKFHAVLMIHSAHLAGLAAPDRDRWLPILWAVDRFKDGQAATKKESGWRMKPADDAKLPPARKARERFVAAMDNWDEEAADAATASLARSAASNDLFDLYVKYGSRDLRDIGHKAIYVANAFRTLGVIGWQHAEPILRSLTYALLQHEGENPAKRDGAPDLPGRRNAERAAKLGDDWLGGTADRAGVEDHLARLRTATIAEAGEDAVTRVAKGASPKVVWDGLLLGAGELLMRQPAIVGLHSMTTMNALRYAFDHVAGDGLRRFVMLQAASYLPHFREAMKARGKVGEERIDQLKPTDAPSTIDAVYATLTKDKAAAAAMALRARNDNPTAARHLADAGRNLIFLKGTDSHDYKFSSAVLEDAALVSPPWRDRFRAASLYWMKGSDAPDAGLAKRIKAVVS